MSSASFGPLIGMAVVAGFAVCWVVVGARSLGGKSRAGLTLAASVVSTALVWHGYLALQRGAGRIRHFDGLAYGGSVAFEGLAIPLAVVILKRTGKSAAILPTVALIVGLHFFGLVRAFRSEACWWLGGAMCLLALFALACLPEAWAPRNARTTDPIQLSDVITGLGCALILWCALLTTF